MDRLSLALMVVTLLLVLALHLRLRTPASRLDPEPSTPSKTLAPRRPPPPQKPQIPPAEPASPRRRAVAITDERAWRMEREEKERAPGVE